MSIDSRNEKLCTANLRLAFLPGYRRQDTRRRGRYWRDASIRFWRLASFMWLLTTLGVLAQGETASAETALLQFEGTVQILRAGSTNWIAGQTNQFLRAGDQVKVGTRSRAVLRMSDRTLLRLGAEAHIRIPQNERSWLDHFKGLLYFFHRDKPRQFPVRTPTAYAVVLGTEFNVDVADDGTTRLVMIDGQVQLTNALAALPLMAGEGAIIEPNQPPRPTAVLRTLNEVQWCLYYPGVLDLNAWSWPANVEDALSESLAAYRAGDLVGALAHYPTNRPPGTPMETVYAAGLLLAVGQVDQASARLQTLPIPLTNQPEAAAGAAALRHLMAAVTQQASSLSPSSFPDSSSFWLAESYARQSRADLRGALEAARQAADLSPDLAWAWARVAELEFGFGKIHAAKQATVRALALAPRLAPAHVLQGFLLLADNETDQATTAFDRAMALDGAMGDAWLGRGLARIRHGQIEAGRQDLQVAATVEPQRALLRSYLGKAYAENGDWESADKELDLARRLDPGDPTAWLYLALMRQEQNRINEAVEALERSRDLNDRRAVYRSRQLLDQDQAVRGANLATIYEDAGMTDLARRAAIRAVQDDYANYSAHLFLANSYHHLRDPNQVNLRYETPWLSEYLMANLLAPVGAGTLSQTVSQQEYSRLFERNRLGVVSSTEYLSRGDWKQAGAQFGHYGDFAYAIEAYYQSRHGQRPNNDLDQTTLSLQLKQQLTVQDAVYVQVIDYDAEGGHLSPVYDPTDSSLVNTGLRFEERQEPILLAGYHHQWSPSSHSLVLAGRLDDTLRVNNPEQGLLTVVRGGGGAVTNVIPTSIEQDYQSELEAYTLELQHIFRVQAHTLVAGGRYLQGDLPTRNNHGQAAFAGLPLFVQDILQQQLDALPPQHVSPDFDRVTLYAYDYWEIRPELSLVGGVTYDHLTYPRNFRYAPLSEGETDEDQVSPKAGAVWRPWSDTVLRAGYGRSLGGVGFDQSFQLEPTQVAGVNQSWRSLIPEAVTGANAAESFQSAGMAWEQKFPTRTYTSVEGGWWRGQADRPLGVYQVDTTSLALGPSALRQDLHFRERSLAFTVNQLVGEEWSLGARYRLTQTVLTEEFPGIPASAATSRNFQRRRSLESFVHTVRMFALYTHPSGIFLGGESLWLQQSNRGHEPDRPGDDFWQFNLYAGYRFPRRHAEFRVGLLNVTDQDYRLDPLYVTGELPRERTFAASVRIQF